MASPMPVLPLVGSTIFMPFFNFPRCSASSIMARAMRSFTLPPGLKLSSFTHTSASDGPVMRESFTMGVLPIMSRMVLILAISALSKPTVKATNTNYTNDHE